MWSEWYSALVIYPYFHLDLMKRLYNKASAKKIFAKAGIPIPVTFGFLVTGGITPISF